MAAFSYGDPEPTDIEYVSAPNHMSRPLWRHCDVAVDMRAVIGGSRQRAMHKRSIDSSNKLSRQFHDWLDWLPHVGRVWRRLSG